ncbi:hypothetical protein CMI47_03645 [Candidatus Pacearchaeota archaeon]|nr:hypothetical protein [Candidatus Pacearchaeota archaeon]
MTGSVLGGGLDIGGQGFRVLPALELVAHARHGGGEHQQALHGAGRHSLAGGVLVAAHRAAGVAGRLVAARWT